MCLFCGSDWQRENTIYANDLMFVVNDRYPVSKGHLLIIPKRHVETYFALTQSELSALDDALKTAYSITEESFHPDGYNIGINQGRAAGQTIFHLHVHLIPRYQGDVETPEGGVRGVIKGKQQY